MKKTIVKKPTSKPSPAQLAARKAGAARLKAAVLARSKAATPIAQKRRPVRRKPKPVVVITPSALNEREAVQRSQAARLPKPKDNPIGIKDFVLFH